MRNPEIGSFLMINKKHPHCNAYLFIKGDETTQYRLLSVYVIYICWALIPGRLQRLFIWRYFKADALSQSIHAPLAGSDFFHASFYLLEIKKANAL